uniref:Uncharacterized protein n=1 Tax=viral metagenome TaxID=1070528 RepID=A0A6C0CZ28_9ZZZZ
MSSTEYILKNKLFDTAIFGNYTYLAQSLLEWRGDNGEYIDASKDNDWAITDACINGNTHIARILLDWKGPTDNTVNPHTHKVILDACRNGHVDIVKLLLEWYNLHHGLLHVYIFINCLRTASINDNNDVVSILFNYNISTHTQYLNSELIDEIVADEYLYPHIIKQLRYMLIGKIYLYPELTRLARCKILDKEKTHCNDITDPDIQKNSIILINRTRYTLNSHSLQRDLDIINLQRMLRCNNSGSRIPEELFYEIIKYL